MIPLFLRNTFNPPRAPVQDLNSRPEHLSSLFTFKRFRAPPTLIAYSMPLSGHIHANEISGKALHPHTTAPSTHTTSLTDHHLSKGLCLQFKPSNAPPYPSFPPYYVTFPGFLGLIIPTSQVVNKGFLRAVACLFKVASEATFKRYSHLDHHCPPPNQVCRNPRGTCDRQNQFHLSRVLGRSLRNQHA